MLVESDVCDTVRYTDTSMTSQLIFHKGINMQ